MSRAFALALTAATSVTLAAATPRRRYQLRSRLPSRRPSAAPMPKAPSPAAMAAASSPDAVFVAKAADAGARELEIAKVGAQARPQREGVRAAPDPGPHDRERELTSLARAKDVKIPAASAKSAPADLASLAGTEFDKAFIALMVKEHDAAIALFEGESRDGRDAEVKEWAAKQLPTLRDHLEAKSLKTKES